LVNAWDVWSAALLAASGQVAIATSSYSVAEAAGYRDGQEMPLQELLRIVTQIVSAVSLPVSVDFEAGFGDTPEAVRETTKSLIDTGAVGINLEDGLHAGRRALVSAVDHARKIAAVRSVSENENLPLFINARFDGFLLSREHDAGLIEEAIRRAKQYEDAGASGLFIPGLLDRTAVSTITDATRLPVNVMLTPQAPSLVELAATGVSRISMGPWPFLFVKKILSKALEDCAKAGNFSAILAD
jgi:2-methylisocitrate lyase-like PEP mutase family enzyme